jgi:outer membrane lipoprotein
MIHGFLRFLLIAPVVTFAACAQSAHQTGQANFDRIVPADLRHQIDRSVSYPELKDNPENYVGRIVMLGGTVLSAKRRTDRTEIEILELPLAEGIMPVADRTRSEGRFLAIKKDFLDPATVRPGARVTVIGEVKGTEVRSLDDTSYTYPVLEILQLTDWEKTRAPYGYAAYGYGPYGYPAPYPYGLYPYGGYYGRYWGPHYYGGYYPYPFIVPVPSAPRPPPAQVPPQFKK